MVLDEKFTCLNTDNCNFWKRLTFKTGFSRTISHENKKRNCQSLIRHLLENVSTKIYEKFTKTSTLRFNWFQQTLANARHVSNVRFQLRHFLSRSNVWSLDLIARANDWQTISPWNCKATIYNSYESFFLPSSTTCKKSHDRL